MLLLDSNHQPIPEKVQELQRLYDCYMSAEHESEAAQEAWERLHRFMFSPPPRKKK